MGLGLARLEEEHTVEQRDAHRVKEDADDCEALQRVVLRCVALDGEVRSQERFAIVKFVARKRLECSGAHLIMEVGRKRVGGHL